jgi:hypothetical protein
MEGKTVRTRAQGAGNRRSHRRRVRRVATSSLVYLALLVTLLALVTPPAAAVQNTTTTTFLNGPADFCAQSSASQSSLVGSQVYTSASTTSFHYGCSSVLDWPSGALAVRATLWQDAGGTYMICRQNTSYTYNPSPYQFAAVQQNHWPVCNDTGRTIGQSISWVLVGFPPTWQQGGAYTAPTPL